MHLTEIVLLASASASCLPVGGGGCGGDIPPPPPAKTLTISPEQACTAVANDLFREGGGDVLCSAAGCGPNYNDCTFDSASAAAYRAAMNVDAGNTVEGGAEGGSDAGAFACPKLTGVVTVSCSTRTLQCDGRRTGGVPELVTPAGRADAGTYFAECAYLEAVSVLAFRRLALELSIHAAPAALVCAARRAERDEVRHAAATKRLAESFGAAVRTPSNAPFAVRALEEIALENAVEGCVRETYGAALALFRANHASTARVRSTMQRIAEDECRHADLSWAIAAWVMPLLDAAARARVVEAQRRAITELEDAADHATSFARDVGLPTPCQRRNLVRQMRLCIYDPALAPPCAAA
jgi:hypothetical protein